MGLENKFVGYVYLVDENCKVRDVRKVDNDRKVEVGD